MNIIGLLQMNTTEQSNGRLLDNFNSCLVPRKVEAQASVFYFTIR